MSTDDSTTPSPKRSRARLSLVLGALLVVGAAFVLWRVQRKKSAAEELAERGYYSAAAKQMPKARQEALERAASAKDRQGILDSIKGDKRLRNVFAMATSAIEDIHFVGKVIDQDGKPVPGATVVAQGGDVYVARGSGQGAFRTGPDGIFRIENFKGASLVIDSIRAPGYEVSMWGQQSGFDAVRGLHQGLGGWTECTEKTPCVYKAWRFTSGPPPPGARRGSRVNCVEKNGETVSYPVRQGLACRKPGKGDIDVTYEATGTGPLAEDWRVVLRPVNGGLQRALGQYTSEAPVDGYLPEAVITKAEVTEEEGRKGELLRHFFVRFDDGPPKYARVTVVMEAGLTQVPRDEYPLALKYTINEKGGRELDTFDGFVPRPSD